MRIHRLEIQAFGPFKDRQLIDFDRLGSQGLFLLNGATGAGKTSVLDSVAYALFGRVPGARQGSHAQLRSHHADHGVGPEVLCEFSAGGRRLEVRRSPEWQRPSKRGTGTTREQASTQLREKTAGGWEVKSTRNDEASAEIQALLGMNMEQFTKVVLLAQGDFAAFLRASADERQALLQKLFGTDVYQRLEVRLAQDAKTARDEVAAGLTRLEAAERLARSQAAGVLADHAAAHDAETIPEAGDSEDSQASAPEELAGRELFRSLREGLELAAAETGGNAHSTQQAADALQKSLEDAHGMHARHAALQRAEAERERLDSLADVHRQWQRDYERNRAAQMLAPVLAGAERANAAHERAEAAVAAAAAAVDAEPLAVTLLGVHAASASESQLVKVGRMLTTQLAEVDGARPDELRHDAKGRELARDAISLDAEEQRAKQQSTIATSAHARLAGLDQRRDALRDDARTVEQTETTAAQARALVAAREQHAAHIETVGRLAAADSAAREAAVDAREAWLNAFHERLEHAAGELAANLVDGEPCQVCGSMVHPAPSPMAGTGRDLVQEEKSAKKLFDAADTRAKDAAMALSGARSELAVLAERGGDGELEEARNAVVVAEERLTVVRAAAASLADLDSDAAQLLTLVDGARTAAGQAREAAAALRAGIAATEREITDLAAELERARAGHATLAERNAAIKRAQVPCEQLLDAVRRRGAARTARQENADALEKALQDSEFVDVVELGAALLPAAAASELERKIAAHARESAVNAAQWEQADVKEARIELMEGREAPDAQSLSILAAGVQAARGQAQEAAVAWGLARSALEQLRVTEQHFLEVDQAVAPLREHAEMLGGLADSARGGGENKFKMTLSAYVLAARLEQVAQAASVRLSAMSDSRYTLRHSDAKKGNRKSGLGLEVVDEWTGVSRDTATLSGGESFMASLSLALGLSDVVQYESGGLDMETLFVDEGFGSLDDESLEQVMDALEGLRDGGRVVGLVSHVAEMKQRITTQLHVHKGRHGSSVQLVEDGVPVS